MATNSPRSFLTATILILAAALTPAGAPLAGPASCASLLEAAQETYVSGEFAVAEALVQRCLEKSDVREGELRRAYRLLALIHLQRDELAEATRAVVQILGASFAYEPDPVLDPPAYVALVASVKEQLRVVQRAAAEAASEPAPGPAATEAPPPPSLAAAFRTPRTLYLDVLFSIGSYGGERGVNSAGSAFEEYVDNSGLGIGLGAEFTVTPRFSAAIRYHATRFPTLFHYAGGPPRNAPDMAVPIDVERSSEWVHLVTALGRARFGAGWPASAYVHAGLSGALTRINGGTRLGWGPTLGAGADVALTPSLGGFAELNGHVILPGDALDQFARYGYDVLPALSFGVRYRLPVVL